MTPTYAAPAYGRQRPASSVRSYQSSRFGSYTVYSEHMRLPSIFRVRPIPQMPNTIQNLATSLAPRRSTLLSAALAVCALRSVSQLPATQPTALPAPIVATSNGTPTPNRPHRADVIFADGLLTVRANDSSLHQILSTISKQTGMKITGGVAEERVFGSYGPAEAGTILATLLDGTGVNMFIQEGDAHTPVALVLSPRGGGPTPASISPQDEQIGMDEPPPSMPAPAQTPQPSQQPSQQYPQATSPTGTPGPQSIPQPYNNVLGNPGNVTPTASQIPTTNSVPVDSLPTPSTTTQSAQGIVDTPNPPPPGAGASTPDQIYQQLLQIQKAKAAAAAGTSTAPPPPPPPQAPPQ
jgi:hypothetical protein